MIQTKVSGIFRFVPLALCRSLERCIWRKLFKHDVRVEQRALLVSSDEK